MFSEWLLPFKCFDKHSVFLVPPGSTTRPAQQGAGRVVLPGGTRKTECLSKHLKGSNHSENIGLIEGQY